MAVQRNKTLDRALGAVAIIGSLVLLNVVGLAVFGRLDLTADKQFTLSEATLNTLRALHEPITVRAYFTQDLPPPHATNARYVRDMLEAYYTHAHGNLRFEFIDPAREETAEDTAKKKDVRQDIFGRQVREPTAIERELAGLGIPPVQVRVNEADKLEVKRAYMGLAIHYGERKEVIPVVSETTGLEYDLTTLIRKLARENTPKVALLTGHDGPKPREELARAYGLLSELYQVSEIDLSREALPADLEALLVVGPKTPLGEAEKQALDAFVASGHSVAFFLGAIKPNLQTLQTEDNTPGLTDLLAGYGVTIEPGLVLDAECATINVQQQAGFMRFQQPVRYPFIPVPKSLDNHPLTRGLAQVVFPFMSPLKVTVPEGGPVKAEVLVRSSKDSWVQAPPYDLNPMQRWTPDAASVASRPLVVALSGPLKAAPQSSGAGEGAEARVLVAAGDQLIHDSFFGKTNEALLLNLVDWLVRDDGLLAVRSRGLGAAPLADASEARRNTLKYFNIVGLPLAFVGLGLVRWRRREARRHKISA
jgi:gliding-associated putative ABC transporter substrate-binding component GldG